MRDTFDALKDTVLSTQFLSSFISSSVSHLCISGVNMLFNYHEEIRKMEEFYQNGLKEGANHNFTESLKLFKIAQEDFERIFHGNFFLKHWRFDHKAQKFYIDLCHNYVLQLTWLGEYDLALLSLRKLLNTLKACHSTLQDIEIYKLMAVIYLKTAELPKAQAYFEKCLDIDPHNPEIRAINLYLSLDLESKDEQKGFIEKSKFILETKLFNLNLLSPFHFELNYAYLVILSKVNPGEGQKNLNELIELYKRISLPYTDQVKLERLSQINYAIMSSHEHSEEKINFSKSKLNLMQPKTYSVSLWTEKPTAQQLTKTQYTVYREDGPKWAIQFSNNNEMKTHFIAEIKLLTILKIKNLDQIPQENQIYYLTYTQKALLYKGLDKVYRRREQQKLTKPSLSNYRNLLLVGGISTVALMTVAGPQLRNKMGYQ